MDSINENVKKCEFCGEDMPVDTNRCPYCGSLQKNIMEESNRNELKINEQEFDGHDIKKKSLSNGMKVFLTMLSVSVPGLGQLAGMICAIIFINTEDDKDRRTFGKALLMASIVAFVASFIILFIIIIALMILSENYAK